MAHRRSTASGGGQGRPILRPLALLLAALALLAIAGLGGPGAAAQERILSAAAGMAHPCAPDGGAPDGGTAGPHAPARCAAAGCPHVAGLAPPGELAAPPHGGWPPPAPGVRPAGRAYSHFRPPRLPARA